jgi:hypothetical protein
MAAAPTGIINSILPLHVLMLGRLMKGSSLTVSSKKWLTGESQSFELLTPKGTICIYLIAVYLKDAVSNSGYSVEWLDNSE